MVAYHHRCHGDGRYLSRAHAWLGYDYRTAPGRLRFIATRRPRLLCLAQLLGDADRRRFLFTVGWLFDRFDQRLILVGNLWLLGLSVIWMAVAGSWVWLFVTLVLSRGLGQSALSVVSLTIVAKAFEPQRVGLAMAWYAIMAVPFHLLLIKGVGWAQSDGGWTWREIWISVGFSIMALSGFAFALSPQRSRCSNYLTEHEYGSTLREALLTPAFWVFSLTISIWGMIYSGVSLFNVDIFKERGFDEKLYFNILAMVTLVALISKLAFGWLVNYVSLSRLLAICLTLTAMSLAALPMASRPWHAYLYGLMLGVASGAVALLFFATWRKLYGLKELGKIQGVAQMLTVFASASGPLLFSYTKKMTLSYDMVFQTMGIVAMLMAVVAWFTPVPAAATKVERAI